MEKIVILFEVVYSEEADLNMGLGQRSNIDPLLFILLINDLVLYIPSNDIYIFADELSVNIVKVNIEDLHNKIVLNSFKNWCWKKIGNI